MIQQKLEKVEAFIFSLRLMDAVFFVDAATFVTATGESCNREMRLTTLSSPCVLILAKNCTEQCLLLTASIKRKTPTSKLDKASNAQAEKQEETH